MLNEHHIILFDIIRLKSNSDIDEAVNNFTKIIHSAAGSSTNKPIQMHSSSHTTTSPNPLSYSQKTQGSSSVSNLHAYHPTNHIIIQ
jgi:hypothetical protein